MHSLTGTASSYLSAATSSFFCANEVSYLVRPKFAYFSSTADEASEGVQERFRSHGVKGIYLHSASSKPGE